MKICKHCNLTKPLSEFSIAYRYKGNPVLRSNCKPCASAIYGQWVRDNRARHNAGQLRRYYENGPPWRKPKSAEVIAVGGVNGHRRKLGRIGVLNITKERPKKLSKLVLSVRPFAYTERTFWDD